MKVLEQLVLHYWLSELAPHLCTSSPETAARLTRAAVTKLAPNYGGLSKLEDALHNALRRASAAGVANAFQEGVQLDIRKAPDACLKEERAFKRALSSSEPLELALTQALDSLRPLRGRGARVAEETVDCIAHQIREILPLEGRYGAQPAAELLEDFLKQCAEPLRAPAQRDLGSLLSQLGRSEEAQRLFEACGDQARALLEAADIHLLKGQYDDSFALSQQSLRRAEDAGALPAQAAALRRGAWARVQQGERLEARGLLREALERLQNSEDTRAQSELLEELASMATDEGLVDHAVVMLGQARDLQRSAGVAVGEGRALRLAGRLLCENKHPVEGMLMLFLARQIAEATDPHVEHPLEHYMAGFQATLDEQTLSAIERALRGDWEQQIRVAFAAARCRAPEAY